MTRALHRFRPLLVLWGFPLVLFVAAALASASMLPVAYGGPGWMTTCLLSATGPGALERETAFARCKALQAWGAPGKAH
jgi:hypothetical protein